MGDYSAPTMIMSSDIASPTKTSDEEARQERGLGYRDGLKACTRGKVDLDAHFIAAE